MFNYYARVLSVSLAVALSAGCVSRIAADYGYQPTQETRTVRIEIP